MSCLVYASRHTATHTPTWFSDLLVQMRPWEYLCHHSTQIKAVNRDPGGREESKNISSLFLLTMTCVWRRVGVSAYICLRVCEKCVKRWLCGRPAVCPIHLLSLCMAIIPGEIYAFGCMVARGLFTC